MDTFSAISDKFRAATAKNEYCLKVAEATDDKPWGPTGPQMQDLCSMATHYEGRHEVFGELKKKIDQALDKPAKWRQMYKSLLIYDYMIRNAPESVVDEVRDQTYTIRRISDTFRFSDSKGTDHGLSVRERAKKIIEVLNDPEVLAEERTRAAHARKNVHGSAGAIGSDGFGQESGRRRSHDHNRHSGGGHKRESRDSYDIDAPAGYDPYVSKRPFDSHRGGGTTATSKALQERQEQADLEYARRLQEEENRHGGGGGTTTSSNKPSGGASKAPVAGGAKGSTTTPEKQLQQDAELARQLQEYETRGQTAKAEQAFTQFHGAGQPQKQQPAVQQQQPQQQPVVQQQQPKRDALDDLFGGGGPAPAQQQPMQPAQSGFDMFQTAPQQQMQQPMQTAPQQQMQQPMQQQQQPAHGGFDMFQSAPPSQSMQQPSQYQPPTNTAQANGAGGGFDLFQSATPQQQQQQQQQQHGAHQQHHEHNSRLLWEQSVGHGNHQGSHLTLQQMQQQKQMNQMQGGAVWSGGMPQQQQQHHHQHQQQPFVHQQQQQQPHQAGVIDFMSAQPAQQQQGNNMWR